MANNDKFYVKLSSSRGKSFSEMKYGLCDYLDQNIPASYPDISLNSTVIKGVDNVSLPWAEMMDIPDYYIYNRYGESNLQTADLSTIPTYRYQMFELDGSGNYFLYRINTRVSLQVANTTGLPTISNPHSAHSLDDFEYSDVKIIQSTNSNISDHLNSHAPSKVILVIQIGGAGGYTSNSQHYGGASGRFRCIYFRLS